MQIGNLVGGIFIAFFSATLIVVAPERLTAQAIPAASKKADVSVFGGYTRVTPDYAPEKNNGGFFGLDYTRYWRWHLQPSLEFRGKIAPGPVVGQRTYGGGPRFEYPIRNFHPYADFLISAGTFTFTHPQLNAKGVLYTSDNSVVYSIGGGLDYDLPKSFAARVDYQYEHWSLGTNQTFTPTAFSVGLVYRIPFRAFQSH